MDDTAAIVKLVRDRLRAAADPAKAPLMAGYMKTTMPFYGVQKPGRTAIFRAVKAAHAPTTRAAYRAAVDALWALPHREEKYLAIQFARGFDAFVTRAEVPRFARMIRTGAWWDFVDEIAIRLVGRVLQRDRPRLAPRLDTWIEHDDMWIRRSAIICQIALKDETDADMLFDYCLRCAHEKPFFIRKAIGWALRAHAYVEPDRVRDFLRDHGHRLSGLSVREAAKNLELTSGPRRRASTRPHRAR